MSTAGILNKAADYIETHGWIQGDYKEPSYLWVDFKDYPACCASGAIGMASVGETPDEVIDMPEMDVAIWAFARYLSGGESPGDEPIEVIATFNDAPRRTQTEVITALRQAAKAVDE